MAVKFSLKKSLELLRTLGYDEGKVEIPASRFRRTKDLWGFLDAIAMKDGVTGLLGIQACGDDLSSHIKKYLEGYTDKEGIAHGPNEHIPRWLRTGNRFFIWSWRLRGKKGKRKLYNLREIEFLIQDGIVIHREIPHERDLEEDNN